MLVVMSGTEGNPKTGRIRRLWQKLSHAVHAPCPWERMAHLLRLDKLSPTMRRLVVASAGTVVLLAGIAMIVLPGPAFIVIPLGLIIFATEFIWARRILDKLRHLFTKGKQSLGA